MNLYCYDSPHGKMSITEEDESITAVFFGGDGPRDDQILVETPVLRAAAAQLAEYFAGRRKAFDLPLAPKGTPFQQKVWRALMEIPYGETRSYKDIAEAAGSPKGFRAVGMANNKNPIPVIIPCHRVVGSGGGLTGYAYGLNMKQSLLNLERENLKEG